MDSLTSLASLRFQKSLRTAKPCAPSVRRSRWLAWCCPASTRALANDASKNSTADGVRCVEHSSSLSSSSLRKTTTPAMMPTRRNVTPAGVKRLGVNGLTRWTTVSRWRWDCKKTESWRTWSRKQRNKKEALRRINLTNYEWQTLMSSYDTCKVYPINNAVKRHLQRTNFWSIHLHNWEHLKPCLLAF